MRGGSRLVPVLGGLAIAFSVVAWAVPAAAQMTPDRFIKRFDANGDGKVSAEEFTGRRRPFSFFDLNGDGVATRAEITAALGKARAHRLEEGGGGSGNAGGNGQRQAGGTRSGNGNQAQGEGASHEGFGGAGRRPAGPMLPDEVSMLQIDEATRCGIGRMKNCKLAQSERIGLIETGLKPVFPDGLTCRGIDEGWAENYSYKRGRAYRHGGIDIPAAFDTPIIAVADGTVVATSSGEGDMRGFQVILRHSPAETGLPVWTYTQYAHFNAMPTLKVGDHVRMGQVLGPTGNSGTQGSISKMRRPAIHFAVWYSTSPEYAAGRNVVVPVHGHWMDPNALYRGGPSFDSRAMKALPRAQKWVHVAVMLKDGTTVPAGAKVVWPYTCWR